MLNKILNRENLKFNILLTLFILALISLKWSDAIMADNTLAQKLKGKILLQVEENGEAWYVFPADLKRYYLGRPIDALNLMKKIGLGITNNNLAKIDKLIVKPENTNDYIVKNYTSVTTDGARTYQEPSNLYSFAYPNNWKIKKFDASPNEVQLSDADRDFIEEEKGVITIHKFSTASSTEVGQFKIAVSGSQITKKQEKDFEVADRPAFETSYLYPLAFQKTALIQIDDKNFLRVSLTASKNNYSGYETIYDALVKSFEIKSSTN